MEYQCDISLKLSVLSTVYCMYMLRPERSHYHVILVHSNHNELDKLLCKWNSTEPKNPTESMTRTVTSNNIQNWSASMVCKMMFEIQHKNSKVHSKQILNECVWWNHDEELSQKNIISLRHIHKCFIFVIPQQLYHLSLFYHLMLWNVYETI